MSQVAHIADCPETLDEARILLRSLALEIDAHREDRANMNWLAKRSNLVAHAMNYRVEWDGDLRKRLTTYRLELGDRKNRHAKRI